MGATRINLPSAALAIAGLLGTASATVRAQEPPRPPAGASFEYTLRRDVGSGGGAYAAYTDSLSSQGRYEMLDVAGAEPRFSARYDWRFSSAEKNDSGAVDREATFRLSDRLYTSAKTDLDDFDAQPTATLAVWLWIPPDVAIGQTVRVLDHDLVVRARDAELAPGVPAIELTGTGQGTRDDAYGSYTTTYQDRYLFDPTTGMFLGSDCEERDIGTFEGEGASFEVSESVRVRRASYVTAALPQLVQAQGEQLPYDPSDYSYDSGQGTGFGSDGDLCGLGAATCFGLGVLGFVLYPAYRRRHPGTRTIAGKTFALAWLSPAGTLPPADPSASAYFTPFLEHFVNAARLAGDPVLVATCEGRLACLGIRHREGDIGTILAGPSELCEAMRALLKVDDFFTELRHAPPPGLGGQAWDAGVTAPLPKNAYNLYETYEVLRLEPIPETTYDADVVRPMTAADLPEASVLATKVWAMPTTQWLRAQLGAGDLGMCVRIDGKLVAFALATQAGDAGRVHTLAVDPDHRGRGLGKELMRARLRMLADLGVRTVVTEIADWNHASLDIARKHGFAKVGEMYVESARRTRFERKIVRR